MSYRVARSLLLALPAETAHGVTLAAADACGPWLLHQLYGRRVPGAPMRVLGLEFPNPVGLAAGLDKSADHVDVLGALGFGFIEVGTVTPRAQPGNRRPRLFRIPAHEALINRMGFNNPGVEHVVARLQRRRYQGIVGVNIGKNVDTPLHYALDDYRHCLERVHAVADYVTVNVSSPNTPGLRTLQAGPALDELLTPLAASRDELDATTQRRVPLLVKVAPDLDGDALRVLAACVRRNRIDGVIATNTTIDHSAVAGTRHGDREGGLSGAPVARMATECVRLLASELGADIPVIGVGGIRSAEDVRAKRDAGAQLIQLYTGLIYRGPGLIREAVEAWGES